MGLFSFLKGLSKGKEEEPEVEPEKIELSDINGWLGKKEEEMRANEKKVFDLVDDKINDFSKDFEAKLEIVKGIDIEEKKTEDKLKAMAVEGRSKYIEYAELLMKKLNKLNKASLEKFGSDIDKVFLDFNKSSNMSYERATILIGNEMGDVKNSMGVFSKDIIKILEENKDVIDSSKKVLEVKTNLDEIEKIEKEFGKIKKESGVLEDKISEHEEKHTNVLSEIEKIKKSDDFVGNIQRQERIKLNEGELENDIITLRNSIDFKALGNFFHIFEEQMTVVKAHKDDFKKMFEKDNGDSIVELLNKSNLNNGDIGEKIKKIIGDKDRLAEEKKEVKEDETIGLHFEVENIMQRIGSFKSDIEKVEKRRDKLKIGKEDLIKDVQMVMKQFGIVIS